MTPAKDITNSRFGRLIALFPTEERKNTSVLWFCKCECGNVCKKRATGLIKGRIRSCGCLEKENRIYISKMAPNKKPLGEASFNALLIRYKQSAKKRNLSFSLTAKDFRKLTSSICTYCGREPAAIKIDGRRNGQYSYNGIDRIDSSVGYILENCTSCCSVCNYAKRDMSQKEFLTWINQVHEYRNGL